MLTDTGVWDLNVANWASKEDIAQNTEFRI